MLNQTLVDLSDVSLSLGDSLILHEVSMSLNGGQIVTLIGPNGAGKTTLVRLILGIIRPDKGEIIRQKGLRIGYMPQKVHIDPTLPLTVKRFLRLSEQDKGLKTVDALDLVKAKSLLRKPMAGLSGGEMQRVLLAKAIIRRPNLLILDEPVQGVDLPGQGILYDLIVDIKRKFNCGVLIVSHDLHMVLAASDHVVCLNKHVCCAGTPKSVSQDPAYRQLFGDLKTPISLVPYTHHHDHSHDENPDEGES